MNHNDNTSLLSLVSAGDVLGQGDLTLGVKAHTLIRNDIISGFYKPSQALRLEVLKERYGISFSPIREALNRLQAEKLVVAAPSKGFKVKPISTPEMWDAINTRVLIECEALRLSIASNDKAWQMEVMKAYHSLRLTQRERPTSDCISGGCYEALEAKHSDFHRTLISACGSEWLMGYASQLYSHTERYRRPSLMQVGGDSARDIDAEHLALVDAALAGDANLACELLANHYRETGLWIQKILEQSSGATEVIKHDRIL
ncbi:GntR family transcriptional regulator [Pseudomonas canadensis]|uniref:FCD domain-containing protein n=1 Tax=Pseudomonas canadensis TaxID=915099 RepID=A0ABZ0ZXW7_9PSED|nr:FCD domain-containing protein [Pseudomonas canadensis]WRI21851.1 FCD domain-containing protein [Pseudomonas canadensis]